MANEVAPTGDTQSGTASAANSIDVSKVPSPIDELAELIEDPNKEVSPENVPVNRRGGEAPAQPAPATPNTPAPQVTTPQDGVSREEFEELQGQLMAYQEKAVQLDTILSDSQAKAWLTEHFTGQRGSSGLPPSTGDDVDQADPVQREILRRLDAMEQRDNQKSALETVREFAAKHPDVQDPRLGAAIKAVLARPGYEAISLEDAYSLAKSKLGLSNSGTGGKTPVLQPTESGGGKQKQTTTADDIQRKVDEQDSFDDALRVALHESAKEQGYY